MSSDVLDGRDNNVKMRLSNEMVHIVLYALAVTVADGPVVLDTPDPGAVPM